MLSSRLGATSSEEKKTEPSYDTKSQGSYKSTHSTRSSVLERAREYNRRIEQQHRRAKSLERGAASNNIDALSDANSGSVSTATSTSQKRRSVSAGRDGTTRYRGPATRERALASVRKDSALSSHATSSRVTSSAAATDHTQPLTPASNTSVYSSHHHNQQQHQQSVRERDQLHHQHPNQQSSAQTNMSAQQSNRNHHQNNGNNIKESQLTPTNSRPNQRSNTPVSTNPTNAMHSQQTQQPQKRLSVAARSPRSLKSSAPPDEDGGGGGGGVVTPELLVDALSGHEDGLLAIAERLMEHYDAGYDVMGEAIIDAFADVQKLFQHVVEAAHMEGAAFEASRREEEIAELRKQAAAGGFDIPIDPLPGDAAAGAGGGAPASPAAVGRHDEFIDQDVKDVLTEAIRKGSSLRDANKNSECFQLYERACQAASSLLPVDSDHRGRLQLSIARAESMSHDRACAILRYAMDDVLRSGMRAVRTPLPDPSKRADVVLSRPKAHPGMLGVTGHGQGGVIIQSPDEALASLMEEMKEVMSAPVYLDTPLQDVARRFWAALNESLKAQQKNEERLEQQLGKLKGDYLLAKAEWEEKLNQSNEMVETYKEKYDRMKASMRGGDHLHESRSRIDEEVVNDMSMYGSVKSAASGKASSVASLGSGLAQQAKTIVNSMNQFNCTALNERNGASVMQDLREVDLTYESSRGRSRGGPRSTSNSASARKNNRTFRDNYSSRSPQHVDV